MKEVDKTVRQATVRKPDPQPSLRAAHKEFTRNVLIEAGIKCFRDKGYNATTIEDIARRAGATVRTFYRYFGEKAELLGPMREHLQQEVELVLGELNHIDVRDRKAVRHWLDAYVVMCNRIQKLTSAYWEACYINTELAEGTPGSTRGVVEIISGILDTDESRRKVQIVRLSTLIGCLDRIAFLVSHDASPTRAREMLDEVSKIVWAVLNSAPDLDAVSVADF